MLLVGADLDDKVGDEAKLRDRCDWSCLRWCKWKSKVLQAIVEAWYRSMGLAVRPIWIICPSTLRNGRKLASVACKSPFLIWRVCRHAMSMMSDLVDRVTVMKSSGSWLISQFSAKKVCWYNYPSSNFFWRRFSNDAKDLGESQYKYLSTRVTRMSPSS